MHHLLIKILDPPLPSVRIAGLLLTSSNCSSKSHVFPRTIKNVNTIGISIPRPPPRLTAFPHTCTDPWFVKLSALVFITLSKLNSFAYTQQERGNVFFVTCLYRLLVSVFQRFIMVVTFFVSVRTSSLPRIRIPTIQTI